MSSVLARSGCSLAPLTPTLPPRSRAAPAGMGAAWRPARPRRAWPATPAGRRFPRGAW